MRRNNISLLRFLSTISIFYFHIIFMFATPNACLNKIIPFSLAVQTLAMISGFLYSQKEIKDTKKFLVKNLKKIIIPALVAAAFIAFLDFMILVFKNDLSWTNYLHSFFGKTVKGGWTVMQFGNYWFIGLFIFCYIFTPFFQKCYNNPTRKNKAIIAIIVIIELIIQAPLVIIPYMIGYYLGKKKYDDYAIKNDNKTKTIIVCNIIFAISILLYFVVGKIPVFDNISYLVRCEIARLFQTSAGLSFGIAFMNIFQFINKYKKHEWLFSYTDKLCYYIYLVHHSFMIGVLSVWGLVNTPVDVMLIFIETIISSIIVYVISKKIIKKTTPKDKIKNPSDIDKILVEEHIEIA